jgi:hypothetical protein
MRHDKSYGGHYAAVSTELGPHELAAHVIAYWIA